MKRHLTLPLIMLVSALATFAGAAPDELECHTSPVPASGSFDFTAAAQTSVDTGPNTQVGKIHYTRLPVFDEADPDENNAIFRWANRFHILTTVRTVEQDLLFGSGEPYKPRLVAESARLLRDRDHLYDALIRPVSRCGDVVDVEVITRDVWSFTPEISFDRSGGANTYRFGIAETNLFGSGRELSFASIKDINRSSNRLVFEDSNVAGKHIETRLQYIDSDDGYHQFAIAHLPFFSLDSRYAWRVSADRVKRDDSQYFRGNEISAVRHDIEEYIVSYGFSRGLRNHIARRWRIGYIHRDDRFERTLGLPPPSSMPSDRILSYPFVEFSSTGDEYTTASNIDQIHRTEDLHLGHAFSLRAGFSPKALGADQDRTIITGSYSNANLIGDDRLLIHRANWRGRYNHDTGSSEDVIAGYSLRYYHPQTSHRAFFTTLRATWTHNLEANQQVVLGGENGARAFDNRFQAGDRSVLLSFEERLYTDWHILNLVRVGFAAFVDIGRAWQPGVDDGIAEDYLADIGVGLRLASSKADVGSIVHIDLSFPLTNRDDPAVDAVQLSLNIKDSF